MVSASLHLKGCSVPFISAYKEPIVSSITLNEMLNITYLQFWYIYKLVGVILVH